MTPDSAPARACPVCGRPLPPPSGRRGRPPATHPECRRAYRSSYESNRRRERREGWTLDFVRACQDAEAACEAADGASNLDAWTLHSDEVTALDGEPLSACFVPDTFVRLAGDGGPEVGRTADSPVGPTLGASDVPARRPVRTIPPRPVASDEVRVVVDGLRVIRRALSGGNNH